MNLIIINIEFVFFIFLKKVYKNKIKIYIKRLIISLFVCLFLVCFDLLFCFDRMFGLGFKFFYFYSLFY